MRDAPEKCRAGVELFQRHELVSLMGLRYGPGAANHGRNSGSLKEARFGAIGNGVNVVAAG